MKDANAARVAAVANAWADALAAKIAPSPEVDSVPLLQAELNARISLLSNVSASQYALEWAIEDAKSLRDRLAGRSPSSTATVQDQVLLISLSSQVVTGPNLPVSLNSQVVTAPNLPIQLQITGVSETTVGDQLQYLDGLVVSLEPRRQILQQRAEALQNDIRDLQERLVKAQTLIVTPAPAQVTQRAAVPDAASSPKFLQNVALAGAVGLMLSVFAAFGWEWWKGGGKQVAVEGM